MKIDDVLVERRLQRTEIMFHGTSSVLAPSILKHGLLANPPKATYSPGSTAADSAYDTFAGGVYLTKDRRMASSSARIAANIHGGDPVLVTVQYTLGSAQPDEDDIFALLSQSIIYHTPAEIKTTTDAADYYSDPMAVDRIAQHVIKDFKHSEQRKLDFSGYDFIPGSFKFKQTADRLIVRLAKLYMDQIASYGERTRTKPTQFKQYVQWIGLSELRHNPEYEGAVKALMTSMSPVDSATIRLARNIKFSGKTRILEIRNLATDEILYGYSEPKHDYYFFGNPSEGYAWGIGRTPGEAIADAEREFADWESMAQDRSTLPANLRDLTWQHELKTNAVYPTDKYTYELIDIDGNVDFVKDGELWISKSEHDNG